MNQFIFVTLMTHLDPISCTILILTFISNTLSVRVGNRRFLLTLSCAPPSRLPRASLAPRSALDLIMSYIFPAAAMMEGGS